MSSREAQPASLFSEIETAAPDDLREEINQQTRALNEAPAEFRIFSEFRRKLATYEILSKAIEKLAQALRFSGRITITFHQGRITKAVMKEAYYRGRLAGE